MPPKSSANKTTDFKIPTKKGGIPDERWAQPQFTKRDGKRGERCTKTQDRK